MRTDTNRRLLNVNLASLTKLWLFLVAINVFLQFDTVENFFKIQNDQPNGFVAAKLECSNLLVIGASTPDGKFVAPILLTPGLTNSFERTSFATNESSLLQPYGLIPTDYFEVESYVFQFIDTARTSGLSPPLSI